MQVRVEETLDFHYAHSSNLPCLIIKLHFFFCFNAKGGDAGDVDNLKHAVLFLDNLDVLRKITSNFTIFLLKFAVHLFENSCLLIKYRPHVKDTNTENCW